MTDKKVAHEIVVDNEAGEIRIDGIAFPYHIMEGLEIMSVGDGVLGAVKVAIYADNITFISSEGKAKPVVKASLDAELEWARRRATESVIEDLAPILKQLGKEQR